MVANRIQMGWRTWSAWRHRLVKTAQNRYFKRSAQKKRFLQPVSCWFDNGWKAQETNSWHPISHPLVGSISSRLIRCWKYWLRPQQREKRQLLWIRRRTYSSNFCSWTFTNRCQVQSYVEDTVKSSGSSIGVHTATESVVTVKMRDRRLLVTVSKRKKCRPRPRLRSTVPWAITLVVGVVWKTRFNPDITVC